MKKSYVPNIHEHLYENIYDNIPAGICIYELNTYNILTTNPYLSSWLGYNPDDINNNKIDIIFGSYINEIEMAILTSTNKILHSVKESKCYKSDGTLIDVAVTGTRLNFYNRNCILLFARDISMRKKAEEELRSYLHFLQKLIDTIPNPIFYKGLDGRYIGCNVGFEKFIGLKKEQIIGKTAYDIAPPDMANMYKENDIALLSKPGEHIYEAPVLYADGTYHDVIFHKATYLNNDNEIAGIVGVIIDITQRKQAEKALRISEERYRILFNSGNDAIFVFHLINGQPGNFIEVNDVACKRLGYTKQEMQELSPVNIMFSNCVDSDAKIKELMAKKNILYETVHLTKDNKSIPVEINAQLFTYNNQPTVLCIARDITERKKAERVLHAAHQQLLDIIESLPDATFVIDQHKKIIAWNQAIEKMTGVKKEEVLGKGDYCYAIPFYGYPRPVLCDFIWPEKKDYHSYQKFKKEGIILYAEEYVPALNNGKGAYLWATASPLFDTNGNLVGAIETLRDITEQNRMKDQLKYLATHDSLTGIPNRYSLLENLRRAVAKAKRGQISALLLIDLDNFKLVNDTLGHPSGDDFLITLTNTLKNNLREGDLLARLGGDEFAVLLEGTTKEEAKIVAEKLRHIIDEKELCLVTYKTCFNLTISVGITMIDGSIDAPKLLSYADSALYAAKQAGRNRVNFYQQPPDTLNHKVTETHHLVNLIKHGLKENRFILMFQPICELKNNKIIHYEVLIRLKDNQGQLLLPGRFMPVAERFGLIAQIDRWVIEASLLALKKYSQLKLFINISGISLSDENLLEFIEETANKSGINPERIGFEITETSAVKDLVRAENWIRRLKKLGCSFALDDFGIGFSSFYYLRHLPVDFLKIDGSFIQNLDQDSTNRALVQAISTVAQSLGKKTIAEFVENEPILRILKNLNIDCGQGYYFGKPEPYPKGG